VLALVKKLAAIAALALACGTLAGCGSGTDEVYEGPGAETPVPEATATPETPTGTPEIALVERWSGFDEPLQVTHADDGSDRIFVVEKKGRVWEIEDGAVAGEPFFDISNDVSTNSERGLLSIAFAPDFRDSGVLYADYTDRSGTSVVVRLEAPDGGGPVSLEDGVVRLVVEQPYSNHNGGQLAFGPDGYLYVGFGDGGSGGDPDGNGQDPASLLGKLLRLDASFEAGAASESAGGYSVVPFRVPEDNPFVGEDGVRPEIWALGLRNPWRFSFDRETGDLWIGDVGQSAWEEVDFQPASSAGGENYGWNRLEGTHVFEEPVDIEKPVMPVFEYGRDLGQSVTGGFVYRGDRVPDLAGTYVFGDYGSGTIWGLRPAGQGWEDFVLAETDLVISSFGEDERGELYVVDFRGTVYAIE
jgi:glucose/arabinose dehydrogenase